MDRPDAARLLVAAGLAVWVVAGLAQIAAWLSGRPPFAGALWGALEVAFGIAFVFAATRARSDGARVASLSAQTAAALVALALGRTGFEGALLCVVAGEAPLLVGERLALAWVMAQIAAMGIVDAVGPHHAAQRLFSALAYAGFQLFAFAASRLAVRERAARAELARTHAELLATRELFADATRTGERLRIARELHDALGHHLTALSLQLELARNLVPERDGGAPTEGMRDAVARAHGLAKELLAELRMVVSAMRDDVRLDLSRALRALIAGIPRPQVHLAIEGDLRLEPALAHAIFRCAQEALTNAVRHADAENVHLTVRAQGDAVTVTATDDGRGAATVQLGHGLAGLRERVQGMGGRVEIETRRGAGLTLRALLPMRSEAP